VLLNLIGNCFYAACAKLRTAGNSVRPMLKVTTRDLGGAIEFRVRDNGAGIPPQIRDKPVDFDFLKPSFAICPTPQTDYAALPLLNYPGGYVEAGFGHEVQFLLPRLNGGCVDQRTIPEWTINGRRAP
jgi:hypothetical protein